MVLRRGFLGSLAGSTIAGSFGTAAVGSLEGATAESTTTDASPDRLVGAHYYTWYGPDNHWDNGYRGTPELGEYDSKDEDVIEKHIEWAEDSGINWFNATWWGPDSYAARTLEEHVAPQLAGSDVEFSVLYEPKGRFEYDGSGVSFDERANRETLAADLEHIASEMVGNPNYLHVGEKPVLYVYIAHSFDGDVQGAFADAQSRAGTEFYLVGDYGWNVQLPSPVFDAVSPYNMYRPVENVNDGFAEYVDRAFNGWQLLSEEMGFDFIPVTLPGFDNTEAEWATDGQPVLERSPDRYRELCEVARRYTDDEREMVLVTSFNEWHEYTSVEPEASFGTTYLDITRENLSAGESLSPSRNLVPLRFQWQDYVSESSVSSDLSEGEGRRLTVAVDRLQLLDETGAIVKTYDIGGRTEPIFAHGVSGSGSHNDRSWRWFTANRTMISLLYVPEAVAAVTSRLSLVCRALADDFDFAVSLGDSGTPTRLSASPGWGEVAATLEGQETTTATRSSTTSTATSMETASSSSATPSSPQRTSSSTATSENGTTTTETSSPGFGVGTSVATAGAGTCYAAYRRFLSSGSDNE